MQGCGDQKGFTLIELMISLTIGLFIILGVVVVYVGAFRSYTVNASLSRVQESGRFATEFLARDIRQAGYTGCSQTNRIVNVLNGTPWWSDLSAGALLGYEGNQAFSARAFGTGDGDRVAGTDAILLKGGDGVPYQVDDWNGTNANFAVTDPHNLQAGSIIMVCDPQQTTILQVTNVQGNPTNPATHLIVHNTGNSVSPGNCTKWMRYPLPSGCATTQADNSYAFPDTARLSEFKAWGYYIGYDSKDGSGRSLYRTRLRNSGGDMKPYSEVMVPGVEDMQITYGVDTTGDENVDQYQTADAITDWNQVLSVRVALLVDGPASNVLETATDQLPAPFQAVDTSDRRLRRVFTSTIALRNRLP